MVGQSRRRRAVGWAAESAAKIRAVGRTAEFAANRWAELVPRVERQAASVAAGVFRGVLDAP